MDNPGISKSGDMVAWLILGYLYIHPGSKDTVGGIWTWWLHAEGIDTPFERVRLAVNYLVETGWVTSTAGCSGVSVYGLDQARKGALQQLFLGQSVPD